MNKQENRKLNFRLFDLNTNVTTLANGTINPALSPEMKTFYDKALLRCAEPELIHDQFAQRRPIPKGNGKTIEFRKFSSLPKALTPLTEGVTPDGQNYSVTAITATVSQYGAYIAVSDMLQLTAFDNNMAEITRILGSQAGRTSDTITREVICQGQTVQYVGGNTSRAALDSSDKLTVLEIRKGINALKNANASKISGSWVALIHPDAEFDIMSDPDWVNASQYAGSTQIFNGEIGRLYGVRFVESTEAKIWRGAPLTADSHVLHVKTTLGSAGKTIAVDEAITADEATAMAGMKVYINGADHTIASATAGAAGSATITTAANVAITDGTDGNIIAAQGGGYDGSAIYGTILLGQNAYGVTEIQGGGLRTIVKQLGSGGTADPLDQRATIGWKLIKTAKILAEEYMVRIEHGATISHNAN